MSRKTATGGSQPEIQRITVRQSASIHDSAKRGAVGEIEKGLAQNPMLVNEVDQFGQTPLHIAAFEGHLELAEMLVEHGASLSLQDKNGWTPLHSAASNRHLTIVERLIEAACDLNVMVRDNLYQFPFLSSLSISRPPLLCLFSVHLFARMSHFRASNPP